VRRLSGEVDGASELLRTMSLAEIVETYDHLRLAVEDAERARAEAA